MESPSVIIEINKLGAIENSSIELKPFMIFSGESGLGKSYSAFLIHYIYLLTNNNKRLEDFFKVHNWNYDELIKGKSGEGELFSFKFSILNEWINRDAIQYLKFLLGNEHLEGDINFNFNDLTSKMLTFKYKEEVIGVGSETELYMVISFEGMSLRVPRTSNTWTYYLFVVLLKYYLKRVIHPNNISLSETFMLPPSRGGLVGLTSASKGAISASSGMYSEFLENMDSLERTSIPSNKQTSSKIIELLRNINKGEIKKEENRYYYISNNNKIPLSSVAASIKELTPLSLLMDKYPIQDYSILFEEPEAHLHPQMQMKVAELIAAMVNEGTHFQITTHSDYFIRRINDLINLYNLKNKISKEEFTKFCKEYKFDEDIILPPQLIGAYLLEKQENGSVKIKQQKVSKGVPYDSFQKIIRQNIANSMALSDKLEEFDDIEQ
ncbi:MAG: AAA family ATPase [Dysgonomonas sp.]|uniref:AAA family ATPase n=1 Tax=Dysgonomonas sp. TaxID=1891233 RepID=UPI003A8B8FE7